MKKYFAMLAVLCIAAVVTSCGDDEKPPIPESKVTLDKAVYYGEKLKANFGYYSITLAQGENKLRLDLISDVSDKTDAKPNPTIYSLGTKDPLKKKTTFAAASAEDTEGSIYFKGKDAVLITDAKVEIKYVGGRYTVIATVTAGGESISMQYMGTIKFEDQAAVADRTINANEWSASYQGAFNEASKDMGYMGLILANSSVANQKLQLAITLPLPTEGAYVNDHAKMPIGTFNVASTANDYNQIVAGKLINGVTSQSWELKINPLNGSFNGGVRIEGGTITIEKGTKNGKPIYKISTDLNGTSYDVNQTPIGKIHHLRYVIEDAEAYNENDYILDATAPSSALKADYAFTKLANAAYEIQGNSDKPEDPQKLIYLFLTEKDNQVQFNTNLNAYEFTGDGELVVLQFWVSRPNLEDFLPTGTFAMESDWGKQQIGTCLAAQVGYDNMPFVATAGSWFLNTKLNDKNELDRINSTGMMPKKGTLKLSGTKEAYNVEFEFYDKYGNKMTAKYTTKVRSTESPINQSTSSYMFQPSRTLR